METAGSFSANADGVLVAPQAVEHRDDEYDQAVFDVLCDMQARHFWYLGRHRFLRFALQAALRQSRHRLPHRLKGVDLGGGCGGWVRYLLDHCPALFDELALADSSLRALGYAAEVVGRDVPRYQIDLMNLPWNAQWDVAFLLDVLEHIPDDRRALQQVRQALRPGGLLLVTTPALRAFWSSNDVLAHHVRRYCRDDFRSLAADCGFELCFSRYFMFFLSPLLLLSRWRSPDLERMSQQERCAYLARTHRVPPWPINQVLRLVLSLESPAGVVLPLPWGTSVLAVLQRPN
jgi:SAM-dependent methyltransferase